jgi:alpha-N-acetylglucosamine transferase
MVSFPDSRPKQTRFKTYLAVAAGLILVLIWSITSESHVAAGLARLRGDQLPMGAGDEPDDLFIGFKEFFQDDLPNTNPSFDARNLRRFMPHNYGTEEENFTFATYLSTRNGSMHDPYFAAAQQLTYRMLWDEKIKSKYPFTVFVAPHVPDEQRNILAAAGAVIRELELVPWHAEQIINARWRDMFSKLNIWAQVDFDRVVLLDTDAFPIENIDGVFDVLEERECKRDLIPKHMEKHERKVKREEDMKDLHDEDDAQKEGAGEEETNDNEHHEEEQSLDEIEDHTAAESKEGNADSAPENPDLDEQELDSACNYVFAAVEHKFKQFNGGVLVVKPNLAMHARLLRHMTTDSFFAQTMEQAFLNEFFKQDGPFPAQLIDRTWNGFVPQEDEEGKLKVFHDKLWKMEGWLDRNITWAKGMFNQSWDDMLRLYESEEFVGVRKQDGVRLF